MSFFFFKTSESKWIHSRPVWMFGGVPGEQKEPREDKPKNNNLIKEKVLFEARRRSLAPLT